ncbi:hypothetical protein BST23_01490 [Mycolicibacterium elephantis]|uniref:Uncharacterized protein n=1 Tax=Mycolicibacterium elephantis TaxID=81858 RepID=A0A1X0DC36_9MYCO|nr:hypothetical protein [Mycolicibacterium elephantis]ORA69350.1 hypothetical protein BST23_01490 [Mycolicibacterium elephantis]
MSDENTTETTDVTPEADTVGSGDGTDPDEGESAAVDTPDESETDEDAEPDTFTRDYVEGLRQENGKYRQRAQRADQFAQRLHTELVRATGRLADPTDLPFDESHLDDADALTAAIDDLLTRKPHLAARRPIGEIGQGATTSAGTVDLAAILRGKAG